MRSTSHILHRLCFRSTGVATTCSKSFCLIENTNLEKEKKESCHPVQSISFFPNICWFTTWFLTSSLFIWIIHYLSYCQILSLHQIDFLYILWYSYTTYSDSSMFHHSFSVTDLNHFLISTSISSSLNVRLQFESEILRNTFEHFRFSKTFLLAKLKFYTDLRKFLNLKCSMFSLEYYWNQVRSRTCQNVQTENDRIRTRSRSAAKTKKSMMKCNHKFRVWTIMIDGWRKWSLKKIIWS